MTAGTVTAKAITFPQESRVSPRELAIREFCRGLADLLVAKQRKYGPNAITEAPGGPLNGLRVRLHDKHERFQNMTEEQLAIGYNAGELSGEALEDTALDIAGYGVIASLVLRGDW